jgi:hypothetical protein
MRISMTCALRCGVHLFDVDCTTEAGRRRIESSRCADFLYDIEPLGRPVPADGAPPWSVVRLAGPATTLRWLVSAPVSFLGDVHDMEMGRFDYGEGPGSKEFPVGRDFFRSAFRTSMGEAASPALLAMVHSLDVLFKDLRLYHLLTGSLVLLSICLAAKSSNPIATFLAMDAVLTYLLIVYFAPVGAFRYLIHVSAPAFVAVVIELARARRLDPAESSEELGYG